MAFTFQKCIIKLTAKIPDKVAIASFALAVLCAAKYKGQILFVLHSLWWSWNLVRIKCLVVTF
jgi:hypothetical protein